MKNVRLTLVCMAIFVASGCSTIVPGTYHIVDGRSGQPLAGVKVVLLQDPFFPDLPPSVYPPFPSIGEGVTDAEGSVFLQRWAEGHVLQLSAAGYARVRWSLYPLLDPGPKALGTIEMKSQK